MHNIDDSNVYFSPKTNKNAGETDFNTPIDVSHYCKKLQWSPPWDY